MVKIAIDAGHGINTAGKRTPGGEREWTFNNKVVLALIDRLNRYEGAEITRLDDPTGRRDVLLRDRTNKANKFNADILISVHHNANTGRWGTWTGTETYHYPNSTNGNKLAQAIHPSVVKAYGLRDRGIKSANFHMLRESRMPAILIEGGFMDSEIDIKKLRNDNVLGKAGRNTADALAEYFNLKEKPKETTDESTYTVKKGDTLSAIAKRFSTTVDKLVKDNNIKDANLINVGQKLNVSGSKSTPKQSKPKPSKSKITLKADGKWGNKTTEALQEYLNTPKDGIISNQRRNTVTESLYGTTVQFSGSGNSNVIVALQQKVGSNADGLIGPATIRALQKYLSTVQDGVLSRPSLVVKEMQRRLNAGTL